MTSVTVFIILQHFYLDCRRDFSVTKNHCCLVLGKLVVYAHSVSKSCTSINSV
jgi:hypothetical protein